jgi:hypothetical protein
MDREMLFALAGAIGGAFVSKNHRLLGFVAGAAVGSLVGNLTAGDSLTSEQIQQIQARKGPGMYEIADGGSYDYPIV